MPTIQVKAPQLHNGGQREVIRSPARFRVICAGRRWGKTRLGAALGTMTSLDAGRVWWVAPTYPIAAIAWRQFKVLARQIPGVEIREVERMVQFPYGWLQVKSAEHPPGLRGEGLDLLIVDEAAHIRLWSEVWEQALRPALSDRQGKALFISSPAGFNHFYEIYRHAESATDWQAWTFPSWTNPYLASQEIEHAREQLPALVFRQEYGAEFIQLEGAVFRREWVQIVDIVE